jgi:acyl-CoA synthetase (AMP-forming)/AMP-acid ligase II
LGLFAGLFCGDSGILRIKRARGELATVGLGSPGAFEANPDVPVPSCLVFLILAPEDKHPRDSRRHDKGDRHSSGSKGKGEQATEEEIIEHCRERLASYKKPSVVEFRDSLPKNAMQKVLKTVLREAAIKKP